MGCLGLHFALDAEQVAALQAVEEGDRVDFVQETFEETLWSADKSRAQETDKAWDAIHRSLTDGSLGWLSGEYPLNHVIFGGEALYSEDDYILSLKSPEQVRDAAAALRGISKEKLRAGYDDIDPDSYGMPLSDEDFEYTWDWFQGVVEFYQRAAAAGHSVLFTADQ
jgi:hypothetical protein